MKRLDIKFKSKETNIKKEKGITLVALVVTIVVLLILAGVSLNLLIGNNGIMTRAKQSKISNDLSAYKEQLAMFIADKKVENPEFYESSLTAGKNNLYYNTKTSEDEKTIKDIIKDVKDEYLDSLEVVKGKLTINTQDKNIIKVAQAVGVEPNPYVIKDGELMSNNGNLLLVDEQGTLTLPDSVTKIGEGAFANVEGLKTIIIPGTVKTIGTNAFANNLTLEKVVIQEGVERVENSAFENCSNLADVKLPESINYMGRYIFTSCVKLKSIEIPSKVEELNEMIFSMSGLESIILRGNKIKRIEREALFGCKIEEFTITKDVEYIDATAFDHCTNLGNIVIDKQNNNYIYQKGLLMPSTKESILFVSNKYYEKATTFEIPSGVVDFTCRIDNFSNITKLIVPASTTNINSRTLPVNISTVEIEEANEKYKIAEDCIYTKTSPETLVFCYSKATEIELKEPAERIGENGFKGATNVTKIKLSNETKQILGQTFNQSPKLTKVEIGEKVEYIQPQFILWTYTVDVEISEANPYYTVEDGILYNKNKDTLITVIKQINGKFTVADNVKKIVDNAFYSQAYMEEIDLNSVEEINSSVFCGCYKLNKIEIPATIKKISTFAFNGATATSQIIIHRKENAITGSPFESPFGLRAIEWVGDK